MKLVFQEGIIHILGSHSARSAWIETDQIDRADVVLVRRTPQGVRGLKPRRQISYEPVEPSHSARSAWIETYRMRIPAWLLPVALRKECVD